MNKLRNYGLTNTGSSIIYIVQKEYGEKRIFNVLSIFFRWDEN